MNMTNKDDKGKMMNTNNTTFEEDHMTDEYDG
jgi:hypothetical protein